MFWLDPRAYKEHPSSQLLSVASSLLITCLSSRQVRKFLCLTRGKGMVSSTADLRVGLCNIVYVEGSWMLRLVVVGSVHCYSLICRCRCYSGQPHQLTWFAITRRASRTSLASGSWMVWHWTGGFFGNGAIKEKLIYTYTDHRLTMVERSICKAPVSVAKNRFESGNGYVL